MNAVHEIINYLTSLPASTWSTLLAYLAGSTLVAGLVQILKHKLNIAEAKKLVTFLMSFLSFLTAFADFILQQNATSPLPTLGKSTAYLIAGAVVIHRYAVSPTYYKLVTQLTKFKGFLQELQAFQQAQKSATTQTINPVTDVPESLKQFQV